MNKHSDLINVFAANKIQARHKVLEFLNCYQKQKITIIAVEGTNNHYEVEVQYYDDYDMCAEFNSKDYKEPEDEDILSLKYVL